MNQYTEMISCRVTEEQIKEVHRVCSKHEVKRGDLIRRGIDLAIAEILRQAVDNDRRETADNDRTKHPDTG